MKTIFKEMAEQLDDRLNNEYCGEGLTEEEELVGEEVDEYDERLLTDYDEELEEELLTDYDEELAREMTLESINEI